MNTRLLVLRELIKRIKTDTTDKVLTHALGLSSLVYFSTPFIKKTMESLGYTYTILEQDGMLCLVAETDTQIYISFRGTKPKMISNWKKILNFIPKKFMYDLKAHGGFVLYHRQYERFVKDYINKIEHNNKEIIFTGHSLGAAIASLYNISYTKNSKCICFALPNVLFNSPFITESSVAYRIKKDFVTWIPNCITGFKWSIPTKSISIKSIYNKLNPIRYHALDNYIQSILNLTI